MKTFSSICASALIFLVAVGTLLVVDFGVADTAVNDDWPTLQHDLTHSGFSTSNAPLLQSNIVDYTTNNAYSSPVVVNGRVFIGSITGLFYCFDAYTGTPVWIIDTNLSNGMISSIPTIVNDRLYLGLWAYVYCLNVSNGDLIWNYTTDSGIIGSCPAVANDRVYIGSPDCNMYCLDATTGNLIWNYTTGDFVFSSPVVSNGIVYFGSHDCSVYALNASNGAKIWHFRTGLFVDNSPAISNGKLYIGSADSYFYCLDATTGSLLWVKSTGGRISEAPCFGKR